MLKRLTALFNPPAQQQGEADTIEVAACALLLELAMADSDISSDEIEQGKQVMRELFQLDQQQLTEIGEIAQERRRTSGDLYSFTKLITDHYDAEQRRRFIYSMWLVAYADQRLDKYEESLIRKIAELIHVPHSVYIQTKLAAKEKALG